MMFVFLIIKKNLDQFLKQFDEVFYCSEEELQKQIEEELLEKATKEAREKGYKLGMEEGLQQGIQKGIQKGQRQEALMIAKNMLNEDFDVEMISKITNLSKKELEKIS